MGKKADKSAGKKAKKPLIVQGGRTPRPDRDAIARVLRTYTVLRLPRTGYQGRFAVADISGPEPVVIARYETSETAAWVRGVMEAGVKA